MGCPTTPSLFKITSKAHGIPGTEVRLDSAVETSSGLLHVSYAFCPNLLTYDELLVDQVLGTLSSSAMSQINSALKSTLGLP